MQIDDVALTLLHLHLLLPEGDKQVFHQAPVEKGTKVVDPCHFEIGKIAHLCQGLTHGGHQTLVLVQIDEDLYLLTDLDGGGNFALRQQDFTIADTTIQIISEIYLLDHFQVIRSA